MKKNLMRGLTAVGMSAVMLLGTAQAAFALPGACGPGETLMNCGGVMTCTTGGSCPSGALGSVDVTGLGFFTSFSGVFTTLLTIVFVLAAILVFGFLVMGGIEYITSGGEKSKTESARNKITSAIIGLVIIVASWALMSLIITIVTGGKFHDLNGILTLITTPAAH